MDAEFVNTYTEVVVENFDAVLKQNLMLQTQLKVLGKKNQNVDEVRNRSDAVQKENSELKEKLLKLESDLTSLKTLEKTASDADIYRKEVVDLRAAIVRYDAELKSASLYKDRAEKFESISLEKDRIQQALNSTMSIVANLEEQIKAKEQEIANLKETVQKNEEVPSELKKTVSTKAKNGKTAKIETPPPKSVKIQSGGFF